MPRDVDLEPLRNKSIAGIYVINVPTAHIHYYKIGISEEDIERRISAYAGYYPFQFHIVSLLLYKDKKLVRKIEKEILDIFKDDRVFGYKDMSSSEWLNLDTTMKISKLKVFLYNLSQRDGSKFHWFADDHTITLP